MCTICPVLLVPACSSDPDSATEESVRAFMNWCRTQKSEAYSSEQVRQLLELAQSVQNPFRRK